MNNSIKLAMNAVDCLHNEFKKSGYNSIAQKAAYDYVDRHQKVFGATDDDVVTIKNHIDVICYCNW